ncbi:MAG: sugar transferase [Tannerella sp.]|jgi:exopolysaccharide biosynthesis polyprenyl glycosylphosphotransferase|nr:sugar transferase [Tannerella sp.]
MNKRKQIFNYILSDFLAATVVWFALNILRYYEVAQYESYTFSLSSFLLSSHVLEVQTIIPLFWLALYYFSGYYNQAFGKSRIHELFTTFISVSIGVVLIFFLVILNDLPPSFKIYYIIFFSYYFMQFFCTCAGRFFITSHALIKMQRHEWASNVLIIGTGATASKARIDINKLGYRIIGFIKANNRLPANIADNEILGAIDHLPELITTHKIDELIVIPENEEETVQMLYSLYHYKCPIKVWMKKNVSLFRTEVKTIHGIPLIDVTANNFSEAGKNIKCAFDKIISVLALLILSPLYAYIAMRVKLDSKGPVFFRQERIGYMGRPFMICKFRTMYVNAVEQGFLLTDKNDRRVTRFGRFLRKYRLDEIPQFWNVLKGDMSLVGPRPEQRYYIDQIVKKAPYYYLLHNVRPGITSWGMVKFGYAENVDKMIERLNYDIMYYENMSLTLDLTILIYTIKIVFTGKGV